MEMKLRLPQFVLLFFSPLYELIHTRQVNTLDIATSPSRRRSSPTAIDPRSPCLGTISAGSNSILPQQKLIRLINWDLDFPEESRLALAWDVDLGHSFPRGGVESRIWLFLVLLLLGCGVLLG